MKMINLENQKSPLVVASAILGLALIIAAGIAAWAVANYTKADQTVVVTGSARRRIKSDLIVWQTVVSASGLTIADGYNQLKSQVPQVKNYLQQKWGIAADQIVVSSVTTQAIQQTDAEGQPTGNVQSYTLRQSLEVRSTDVDKIGKLSREVTELINQGIFLESNSPQYIYTKLSDLKVEMLAEAAKDAKLRAEQIATSTGSRVGTVRAARMGVLQITAADSNQVSDYGMNDTSALEKDITAVVNVTFGLQ
jgi:uncharacterized protein